MLVFAPVRHGRLVVQERDRAVGVEREVLRQVHLAGDLGAVGQVLRPQPQRGVHPGDVDVGERRAHLDPAERRRELAVRRDEGTRPARGEVTAQRRADHLVVQRPRGQPEHAVGHDHVVRAQRALVAEVALGTVAVAARQAGEHRPLRLVERVAVEVVGEDALPLGAVRLLDRRAAVRPGGLRRSVPRRSRSPRAPRARRAPRAVTARCAAHAQTRSAARTWTASMAFSISSRVSAGIAESTDRATSA